MHSFEQLEGTWRSSEPYDSDDYLCEYTISGAPDSPHVEGVDLQDGEAFVVSDIAWDGATLSFTTLMPSTGRVGRCRFRVVAPDRVESKFSFTVVEELTRYRG